MMRPVTVYAARALADPPVVTYTRDADGVHLTWTDGTPAVGTDLATWGNPANEVGFRIERANVANNGNVGAYTQVQTALANATTYTDPSGAITRYSYRVIAWNAAGTSVSMPVLAGPAGVAAPAAPTNLTGTLQSGGLVSLTFRDNATTETGFVIERSAGGATFVPIATPPARNNVGNVTYVDTRTTAGTTYQYQVKAVNGGGSSAYSTPPTTVILPAAPAAPTNLAATAARSGGTDRVTLTWTNIAPNVTGFTIQRSTTAAFTTVTTSTAGATATTFTQTGVPRNRTFYYRIRALNLGGASTWSNVASILTP